MIHIIICFGAVFVLSSVFVRDITATSRGLGCWTISSVTTVLASVLFFAEYGSFSPEPYAIRTGILSFAVLVCIILLIELAAPSHRLRRREKLEYNSVAAEKALNTVFVIICAALMTAAVASSLADNAFFIGFCLVPAAAISIRQLLYFLYLARLETTLDHSEKSKREESLKRLKARRKEL